MNRRNATQQHTATHCNPLQHTATLYCCFATQHTATFCNTLLHTSTYYNTQGIDQSADPWLTAVYSYFGKERFPPTSALIESLQHTSTYHNTLQHTATHCNTMQHTSTYYNTRTHHNTLQLNVIFDKQWFRPTSALIEGRFKLRHPWQDTR